RLDGGNLESLRSAQIEQFGCSRDQFLVHLTAPGQADGGVDECRHAFATTGETHFFARGRLYAHSVDRDAGKLSDPGTHLVAVRADPRSLTDDGDVDMGNAPAARLHPVDGESEKAVRRDPPPLRIGGRKMHADIAFG